MEKVTKFNVAEYLDTDELKTLYIDEVAKDNHVVLSSYRYSSKGERNRKQWILSREGYIILSPNSNPTFSTGCKILNAIGYPLVPTRISKKSKA